MIGLIKACLILNIVIVLILLVWVTIMGIWHFKKDIEYQKEKAKLKQSRDYLIEQLIKRSEKENV